MTSYVCARPCFCTGAPYTIDSFFLKAWASCSTVEDQNSNNYPHPRLASLSDTVSHIGLSAPQWCHILTPLDHYVLTKCNKVTPSEYIRAIAKNFKPGLGLPDDFDPEIVDCYFKNLNLTLVTDVKYTTNKVSETCNSAFAAISSAYEAFLEYCQVM